MNRNLQTGQRESDPKRHLISCLFGPQRPSDMQFGRNKTSRDDLQVGSTINEVWSIRKEEKLAKDHALLQAPTVRLGSRGVVKNIEHQL